MVRRGTAGTIALVVVALAGSTATAPAGEPAPRPFYGVVSQVGVDRADLARMAKGQVGTLRVLLDWSQMDPSPVPDDYHWGQFDELVGAASRAGIDVLPFAFSVPRWVSLIEGCTGPGCAITPPHSAPGLNAWGAFLGAAADRYGPGGDYWAEHPEVPARPLRVWQIWNEENDPGFFEPQPDVDTYAELLRTAAEAIRDSDADAEIVLGGMCCHPLHGRDGGIRFTDYLRELYAVPGIEAYFDGVAIHPYAKRIGEVKRQVEDAAGLVHDELDDAEASIWITEVGWSSSRKQHPLNRGPRGQAQRLRRAFRYFTRERDRLALRSVLWYSWRDVAPADAQCNWCALSGLFPAATLERPKRSWRAFVRFTGGS